MDRPPDGRIQTTDKDIIFEVDEWTHFLPWTVLMDGFGRRTINIFRVHQFLTNVINIFRGDYIEITVMVLGELED